MVVAQDFYLLAGHESVLFLQIAEPYFGRGPGAYFWAADVGNGQMSLPGGNPYLQHPVPSHAVVLYGIFYQHLY